MSSLSSSTAKANQPGNQPNWEQNKLPEHLKDFPETHLKNIFRENYFKIERALLLIKKIEPTKGTHTVPEQINLNKLQQKIHSWALHHLFRVAKVPIKFSKDAEASLFPLPFVEYIFDNEPQYYRGDGGGDSLSLQSKTERNL